MDTEESEEGFQSTLEGLTAMELMEKKDSIEMEIKEFMELLESQKGVGMHGPLVDREGYPRSDIDIYSVRVARNRVICLQNDHKKVMTEIEKKLHELHQAAREEKQGSQSSQSGEAQAPPTREVRRDLGFARVTLVSSGSPAATAGLLEGDILTEFGSVHKSTFSSLQDVARVVQHSQGKPVRVVVIRENQLVTLSLVPNPWSGRGLLGYERRQEADKRVIGSLLGVKVHSGLVEILNSYAVPHNETAEEVAVDMDFDKEMVRLHQKVRTETLVGWYSTFQASNVGKLPPPETMMHSVLIHDYYSRYNPQAIFLTVDTSLRNSRMDIRAYLRCKVGVPNMTEGIIFTPVPCEVVYFEPERVGIKMLRGTLSSSSPVNVISEFAQVEKSVDAIDRLLTKLIKYVEDVQSGAIPANGVVGRLLMETISRVPQVDPSKYEAMLNATMQDLLMVVYLADLTKTQVVLSERLCQLPS